MNSEGGQTQGNARAKKQGQGPQSSTATPREGEKGGVVLEWYGGKQQLKPVGRKNGCSLVWRMQSKEKVEEG